jgi:hypothetical protein
MRGGAMTIVLEHLTLRTWLRSVLPRVARARSRPRVCFYIDASHPARVLARVSARALGMDVLPLEFRLADVRDDAGLLLRLRIAHRDLGELQAAVVREPAFAEALRAAAGSRLATALLKGLTSIDPGERGNLWRALFVIEVVRWAARRNGGDDALLFLDRRPWMHVLVAHAARRGVTVAGVPPTSEGGWRGLLLRLLGPRGLAWARYLYVRSAAVLHTRWSVVRRSASARARTSAVQRPMLAVEHNEHLNLDDATRQSDLFFWQRAALAAADVLVLLRRCPDSADLTALARHGMRTVALDRRAAVPGVPIFAHRPPLMIDGAGAVPAGTDPRDARWLDRRRQAYHVARDYWEALFRREGVKVFVSWYRYDGSHCAIADALERVGGVTTVYQRAFQPDASVETTVDADVMFGYGPGDARMELASGSRIRQHVTVGYLGDHRFAALCADAARHREALHAQGARRIVAYFDENSADDARWHTGHEWQRANYAFLLERLLAEPSLGLLLKPKMPATLRRRLGPIASLLRRAEATGRCVVYETGPGRSTAPPAAAALAADVAIHGHLCAGTAGVEAALAGTPTLLLDREGWAVSSLYQLGVGRVVFTDWRSLWAACQEHWRRPDGVPGFGDWSAMLDEIDPFRDGRAAERMGTYLAWLLEAFRDGFDRDAALALAAERYAGQWGKDKITEVNGRP